MITNEGEKAIEKVLREGGQVEVEIEGQKFVAGVDLAKEGADRTVEFDGHRDHDCQACGDRSARPSGIERDETLDLVLGAEVVIRSTDILEVQKILTMEDGTYDPLMRSAGKSLVGRLLIVLEREQEKNRRGNQNLAGFMKKLGEAMRVEPQSGGFWSIDLGDIPDGRKLIEVATALYERASKVPDGPVDAVVDPKHEPQWSAQPTKMSEVPDEPGSV